MKDKEYNKYARLDIVKCDTPEKLEIIKKVLEKDTDKEKQNFKAYAMPNPRAYVLKSEKKMAIEEMAKEVFSSHNWREELKQVSKDSVVLSKEEFELMKNELRDKVYQACKLEKQKTAEKIINHFVAEFPILKTRVIARELAKQFGVEIKE